MPELVTWRSGSYHSVRGSGLQRKSFRWCLRAGTTGALHAPRLGDNEAQEFRRERGIVASGDFRTAPLAAHHPPVPALVRTWLLVSWSSQGVACSNRVSPTKM